MRSTLEGKGVLITGAASGIGLNTARGLVARGARVAVVDLDAQAAESAAAELGGDCFGLGADITDREAIASAVDSAAGRLGGLDVVVANAGVGWIGTALEIDPDVWERNVEINVLGTWRTIKPSLPHLVESRGYLLVTSSVAALAAVPALSAYALSRSATESLGGTLRVELAHHGVDVGVAYYSWIKTPLVSGGDDVPAFGRFRSSLRWPLSRTYKVEDAAAATVKGIERRSRRVMYPGWICPMFAMRGMLGPMAERDGLRAMPEIEQLDREEIERVGPKLAPLPPAQRPGG